MSRYLDEELLTMARDLESDLVERKIDGWAYAEAARWRPGELFASRGEVATPTG